MEINLLLSPYSNLLEENTEKFGPCYGLKASFSPNSNIKALTPQYGCLGSKKILQLNEKVKYDGHKGGTSSDWTGILIRDTRGFFFSLPHAQRSHVSIQRGGGLLQAKRRGLGTKSTLLAP